MPATALAEHVDFNSTARLLQIYATSNFQAPLQCNPDEARGLLSRVDDAAARGAYLDAKSTATIDAAMLARCGIDYVQADKSLFVRFANLTGQALAAEYIYSIKGKVSSSEDVVASGNAQRLLMWTRLVNQQKYGADSTRMLKALSEAEHEAARFNATHRHDDE